MPGKLHKKATTGAQYRFMAGIANGMTPRSGVGPSQAVAEEMVHATPAKKRSAFAAAISKRRKKNEH